MDALKRTLAAGKIAPVYLFGGSEELLRREAVDAVRAATLDEGLKDLNETRLLWKETDMSEVTAACRSLPMLGRFRVVIVQGVDGLTAEQAGPLAEYLKDPSPQSVLVMTGDFQGRSKAMAAIKKVAVVREFNAPYANRIPAWLAERAPTHGATIEPAAAALLGELMGNDLSKLDGALERLVLYASVPGEEPRIRLADVEASIARTREHSIFELAEALGHRKADAALRILLDMLDAREIPIRIVAMVARHFRRLWEAREALSQGVAPDEVGRRLRVHSFFLRDFVAQARLFTDDDYERLLGRLYETDRALKSSRAAPEMHLYRLLLDICVRPATDQPSTRKLTSVGRRA